MMKTKQINTIKRAQSLVCAVLALACLAMPSHALAQESIEAKDRNGKVMSLSDVMQDISWRKKVSAQLEEKSETKQDIEILFPPKDEKLVAETPDPQ